MEGNEDHIDELFEEEFRSCCDDEEWEDPEESLAEFSCKDDVSDDVSSNGDIDEGSLRMFFKGVSLSENGSLGSNASGIGVVMEKSDGVSVLRVQKKLDFFVEDLVAEHLALLDGLIQAQRNGAERIIAFTDSEEVYHQIAEAEPHRDQLLVALGYRILELANNLEAFVLKLVPRSDLKRPLKLAQEAIGILEITPRIYCPFPNCSMLLYPGQSSSSRSSSSFQDDVNCVDCRGCRRLVCTSCDAPWHSLMSCEEFQLRNSKWRRCQQCRRIIELTQGRYHLTCWCDHESCYSCGAQYYDGTQTCQCAFYENNSEASTPSSDGTALWRWENFNLFPSTTEANHSEQERAQLDLIQQLFTGNQEREEFQPPTRCSDSYLEALKDLNQLPWLERFVSVISDVYHEEYIQ